MSASAQRQSRKSAADQVKRILSLEEFKRAPEKGAHVRKGTGLRIEKAEDGEGKPIVFVISTAAVDRHGDTIDQDGWDLKAYEENPVVLWNHDSWTPPIGQSKRVWVEGGKLKAEATFASGEFELAATIEKLIRGGYVRAASVGFTALEYEFSDERDDGESWLPPVDFKRQELREWSPVSIPANPEALVEAKSAGIDLRSYRKWLEQAMDATYGKGAFAVFERAWKAIGEAKTYSLPATKSVDANVPGEEPAVPDAGSTQAAPVAEPLPAVEPSAPVDAETESAEVTKPAEETTGQPTDELAAPDPSTEPAQPEPTEEPAKSIDPDSLAAAIAHAVGQHAHEICGLIGDD